ncbi:GGDEF domain-containing protein [Shewanella denitrificans]|uniref:GGDEF domain-containing protein n=1 Tax=Shewanella denitrificans TaxID=192073 RepID=UPI0003197167|nr:GGDEF domain-containing protein [Shewanella denitrificans]
MSSFYHSCRYLVMPILLTAVLLGLIEHFQNQWLNWQQTIEQMPYWLLGCATIIALQFNRSRLSYIGVLLLSFYALSQNSGFDPKENELILISGGLIIAVFSFIKDRGLISVHSLLRLGVILGCFLTAYLWILVLSHFSQQMLSLHQNYLPFLSASHFSRLPLYPIGLILLIKLSLQSSLLQTSLGVTFLLWVLHFSAPNWLPLAVQLNVIALFFLATVIIDSYFLAYRDELTGLPSRRALFNLSLSLGRKYSVAMVDIDHFKKFNDTYGHDVGDQVLKLVAAKLAQVTGGGKAFRYGGEEFTIVFPRKEVKRVFPHLDDVRESVEEYEIVLREEKRKGKEDKQASKKRTKKAPAKQRTVSVTVSIGCAQHQADQSFEQCMKEADKALYKAKERGRNQVCS